MLLYILFVVFIYATPGLFTVIHDRVRYGKAWTRGVTLNRLLACYGIYMIALLFYTVWEPIDYYVNDSCGFPYIADWCGGYWYSLVKDIEDWLLYVSLSVAVIVQIIYVHYVADLKNKALAP